MTIEKVQEIKSLIEKAEKESAKSEGIIESIQKKWKEEFGSDTLEDAKKNLEKLENEQTQYEERLEKIYNDLLNSYDWEELEKGLE